ncbi:SEC14-like protein 2 like protein [Argiope bruennichi]|uniref:SEC14-like protein 2 like protein n=1 Tax=Argiope bruennichi TaxID=94029 RepID=A0A8T0FXL8_ARGBR|nr:SEC14-like protein 2 like protein [Argiope bruennichi]
MDHEITFKMREDESLYYRFLKARDFNVKQTEDMLRKHIAWRKEYGVDTILTDFKPTEVMLKYFSACFIGMDKEGSPIIYIDMGGDGVGLLGSTKKVDLIKYTIYLTEKVTERMEEQSKKLGKPITNMVQILNFEKVTFAKATNKKSLEMMVLALNMYQDNYPERIKIVYDINTSRYFSMLFAFCKVVISPVLYKKINNFGTDDWQEVLLNAIDADELPAFLGGNKTDPDGNPLCSTFVVHAETIPKRYYMKKSEKKLSLTPGVKKLTLYPFSKQNLTIEIKEANSYLEWEFETKNKDIGFAVYFNENFQNVNTAFELVPKQRIDTYYEPETGIYKCEKPGIYIITFDNSYSWIHPKEIYYRIQILPPKEY